jgi:hypothetical protein
MFQNLQQSPLTTPDVPPPFSRSSLFSLAIQVSSPDALSFLLNYRSTQTAIMLKSVK